MNDASLKPGLSNPVHDAQNIFRNVLDAMSRPGKVISPSVRVEGVGNINSVMYAVGLTLLDYETPYWLSESFDTEDVAHYLSFHTGAKKVTTPGSAAFLFVNGIDELPALKNMALGSPQYPDASSTVLISVPSFSTGEQVKLSGPGIETETDFGSEGLNFSFWKMAQANSGLYPLGVDFCFCSPDALAALPRSTKIEM